MTKFQNGEVTHRFPQLLPGGKALLFMAHTGNGEWDDAHIGLQVLATGDRKTMIRGAYLARYGGDTCTIARPTRSSRRRFPLDRLAMTGVGVPVAEGILGDRRHGTRFCSLEGRHSGEPRRRDRG